jgi:hypothetical protein
MKLFAAFSVLLFASSVFAQTAHVIPLSEADAQAAKVKWETLQHAQKDWDDFQNEIAKNYTVVPLSDSDAGSTTYYEDEKAGFFLYSSGTSGITWGEPEKCKTPEEIAAEKKREAEDKKAQEEYQKNLKAYRKGWENGFQFDKDFKFIVPKIIYTPSSTNFGCGGYWINGTCYPSITFDSAHTN